MSDDTELCDAGLRGAELSDAGLSEAELSEFDLSEAELPETKPAQSSAAREVFSYGLLDQILAQPNLTMFEIARAQRVSKGWRAAIRRSKMLQQKIFLAPCNAKQIVKRYKRIVPAFQRRKDRYPWKRGGLFELHPELHNEAWFFCWHRQELEMPYSDWAMVMENQHKAAFATQPPIQKIVIQMFFVDGSEIREIVNPTGITLHQLASEMIELICIDQGPLQQPFPWGLHQGEGDITFQALPRISP